VNVPYGRKRQPCALARPYWQHCKGRNGRETFWLLRFRSVQSALAPLGGVWCMSECTSNSLTHGLSPIRPVLPHATITRARIIGLSQRHVYLLSAADLLLLQIWSARLIITPPTPESNPPKTRYTYLQIQNATAFAFICTKIKHIGRPVCDKRFLPISNTHTHLLSERVRHLFCLSFAPHRQSSF
jgi:hypothetical protein